MDGAPDDVSRPVRFDRVADAVARRLALAGGLLLVLLATMVCVSVTLRSDLVGAAGVPGDFELVQLATGIAAFCFLPFCQVRRGHIFVDTFTGWLPAPARRGLDALWDVVYALAMALIAWRLGAGAASAYASRETSMVLGIPGFVALGVAALLAAFVALVALLTARRLLIGQDG